MLYVTASHGSGAHAGSSPLGGLCTAGTHSRVGAGDSATVGSSSHDSGAVRSISYSESLLSAAERLRWFLAGICSVSCSLARVRRAGRLLAERSFRLRVLCSLRSVRCAARCFAVCTLRVRRTRVRWSKLSLVWGDPTVLPFSVRSLLRRRDAEDRRRHRRRLNCG
jgi:hypothetical protein